MHISVLQKEVIQYLNPKSNENFIDCTIGNGGHTTAILEKNKPKGKVLGVEIDSKLYQKLKLRMAKKKITEKGATLRIVLVNDSYINLKEIIKQKKFKQVAGIILDVGMCSWHLEGSKRGFSFLKNEPLDMRYEKAQDSLTAEKIINKYHQSGIEKILREYGEEQFTKRIAEEIIKHRKREPIKTSFQLREIIKKATPIWYHKKKIDLATKTFQALRITVNNELYNLENVLSQALDILEPGGRLVVISFHSLEDRIMKTFCKKNKDYLEILTKKPIRASREEEKINPRSRSAKLRAVIKA